MRKSFVSSCAANTALAEPATHAYCGSPCCTARFPQPRTAILASFHFPRRVWHVHLAGRLARSLAQSIMNQFNWLANNFKAAYESERSPWRSGRHSGKFDSKKDYPAPTLDTRLTKFPMGAPREMKHDRLARGRLKQVTWMNQLKRRTEFG